MRHFLVLLFIFLSPLKLWSYPSFIGYGYTSCMSCHYSPHGGGQLNDYGRALFASEIAAKPFWNSSISDEQLADHSSFLGQKPEPAIIKPSIKYRELYLTTNPGAGSATSKKYVMVADLGFAVHFDPNDKYVAVLSAGYAPRPMNTETVEGTFNYHLVTREHYLRTQISKSQIFSVGLMDVAYGVRNVDHTAANRSLIGLGQDDQVHGLLYDYFEDKVMFGVQGFVGNQLRDEILRYNGVSTTLEYEVVEKLMIGLSAYSASSTIAQRNLFGVHTRAGVGKGSALLLEVGTKQTKPKVGEPTNSAYFWMEGTTRLFRGLNFLTALEMLKGDLKEASPESYRYSFGFLYFPVQRLEIRLQAVDGRTLAPTQVKEDTWATQMQLHVSL